MSLLSNYHANTNNYHYSDIQLQTLQDIYIKLLHYFVYILAQEIIKDLFVVWEEIKANIMQYFV